MATAATNIAIPIDITSRDVSRLQKVIAEVGEPVELDFLASKLRERIIRSRRINFADRLIKIYDPVNDYSVGDHIFRHFGKVRTSQRKNVAFDDYAEGEIYEKIPQPNRDYDLVCVRWEDPTVRKQAVFLRKRGAQQYLPVNYGRTKGNKVRFLGPDRTERDRNEVLEQYRLNLLRQVRSKMVGELYTDPQFVTWGPLWYLIDLLEEIDYEMIQKAEEILDAEDGAVATEQLVSTLFNLTSESPRFLHFRFSLNYMLENFFSEKFYCLSHFAGGAWTTRAKVVRDFGSRPLRLTSAKITREVRRKEFELQESRLDSRLAELLAEDKNTAEQRLTGDTVVHVLTYNELVAGAMDVPETMAHLFPEDTRLTFIAEIDGERQEFPTTYHYESSFIANLGHYYEKAGLVPGAIIEISRAETGAQMHIDYRRSTQHMHYPLLEFDPVNDEVRVAPGTERDVDCEVESHAFVPAGDIRAIEDLRAQLKVDVGLYDVLVRLFREYRSSFHPLTLWRMANTIREASAHTVFSMLTAYKAFYWIEEDSLDEYHLSPGQVGQGNMKKGMRDGDVLATPESPTDIRSRVCRPKTYLVNLPEEHWQQARDYNILPISSDTEHIEIRRHDRTLVAVDGELQAAAVIDTPKEVLNPRIRARFREDNYISSVNIRILGEGACDEVEIYHVPDPGVFVELDEDTFRSLVDFYETSEVAVAT